MPTNYRYVALADDIQDNIINGVFPPGEKLPSLRTLHHSLGLSISTIHQAYIELEKRGQVEAREKSGFYVKPADRQILKQPNAEKTVSRPCQVKINDLAEHIITDLQDPRVLQLGAAIPDRKIMPLKQLSRIMKSIPANELQGHYANYDHCAGSEELREELSRRMLGLSCPVRPEDIVTTSGCLEAVSLSLRAVAGPGDTILVESPVFHCFLQLIEDLNMFVIEIPGCPENGIDPIVFEKAVSSNRISACLLNSNFHNPLGSVLSMTSKEKIYGIAERLGIPIIEDDIYGDLYHGRKRPGTFKSLDKTGMVLYCSSFSKSLSPGLRTGWVVPGRYKAKVIRMKLNTVISNTGINAAVAARFVKTGAYDRHLRQLRNKLKNQVSAMSLAVSRYFPKNTQITFPKGGLFLWVVLNPKIDAMEVYKKANAHKISILPGTICSSSDTYQNCLRINCGHPWSDVLEQGIKTLGNIVHTLSDHDT